MSTTAQSAHILLIEPLQELCDLTCGLLEDAGYRVLATGQLPPLSRVRTLAPQLIVLGLVDAGQDKTSWDFLTLLQLHRDVPRMAVLLCTAAVTMVHNPAMAANLDRFGIRVLLMPYDRTTLLRTVAEMLTAQALLDQARDA